MRRNKDLNRTHTGSADYERWMVCADDIGYVTAGVMICALCLSNMCGGGGLETVDSLLTLYVGLKRCRVLLLVDYSGCGTPQLAVLGMGREGVGGRRVALSNGGGGEGWSPATRAPTVAVVVVVFSSLVTPSAKNRLE